MVAGAFGSRFVEARDVAFIVPWKGLYDQLGYDAFVDLKFDLTAMAARWHHAAQAAHIDVVDNYPEPKDPRTYILYDYFLVDRTERPPFLETPPLHQSNLVLCSECSDTQSRDWSIRHRSSSLSLEFNPAVTNYLAEFHSEKFYPHRLLEKYNNPLVRTVPLGAPAQLCVKTFDGSRSIFLDEPHPMVIRSLDREHLQHVFSFKKALRICRLLAQRGFKITSFASRSTSCPDLSTLWRNQEHICLMNYDKLWIPYLTLLGWYRSSSIFFSHYQETHGFAVYENLQMGNVVVVFGENYNPFTIRQFQNGVVLSLYMSDEVCADLIEEYFTEQYCKRRAETISCEATELFSSDTFGYRLLRGIGRAVPEVIL